jgi:hypothetical protein
MKSRLQGNLIIDAVPADAAGRMIRQSLAISGLARFSENEGAGVMKAGQDNPATLIVPENTAGYSRKAAPGAVFSGLGIKNRGVLEKIPKGITLLRMPHQKATPHEPQSRPRGQGVKFTDYKIKHG